MKDARDMSTGIFTCPRCNTVVGIEDFRKNLHVCGNCKSHSRLSWKERLAITVDKKSFTEFDAAMISKNPIGFPGYEEKAADLRKYCGLGEAVITGTGTIQGYSTAVGVMDSNFLMASMGSVVGEKVTRLFEYAAMHKMPVILFTASGGARMQEGVYSLMQMVKTSAAAARHSDAGQLYITVLTDPTTGGVTASFASLGDIILAEPGAVVGFAGKRVIEKTIGEKLPETFQTSEFLVEHGFIDMIVQRSLLPAVLAQILNMHNYKGVAQDARLNRCRTAEITAQY
jgi:acetyl-CoA carboxylase carboxyl transferase subunit beta